MRITEPLPNDGADFKCQRKMPNQPEYICGKKATTVLTMEAFNLLGDIFRMRAVCPEHAVEAEIEVGNRE